MFQQETTVLVIGSGVAGLVFALSCAEHFKVHILCKGNLMEGNTGLAQGGIAAALSWPDESEKHIQDTLQAGCGECDEEAVRFLINKAADAIDFLKKTGMKFQKTKSGTYDLALEAAHSMPRVLHVRDQTGKVLLETLLQAVLNHENIQISEQCYVNRLLVHDQKCLGASYFQNGNNHNSNIRASVTMLASGGIGQLYSPTSNSLMATGDGIALAFEAGAALRNMEFIQFHPTLLYSPDKKPFLISEALRGAGAVLCDKNGHPFMNALHKDGSLAPRDFVCQAIFFQMKLLGTDHVYLDIRDHWTEKNKAHFLAISQRCEVEGIDPKTDLIPVIPAAHYLCGGIASDLFGQTTIAGLLVSGENACTGVHGANRLASNSLLEAVVFSLSAARKLAETGIPEPDVEAVNKIQLCYSDDLSEAIYTKILNKLQDIMTREVGIIRNIAGLEKTEKVIQTLLNRVRDDEEGMLNLKRIQLKQSLTAALLIVKAASCRKQSIGTHYINVTYPDQQIKPFSLNNVNFLQKDEASL